MLMHFTWKTLRRTTKEFFLACTCFIAISNSVFAADSDLELLKGKLNNSKNQSTFENLENAHDYIFLLRKSGKNSEEIMSAIEQLPFRLYEKCSEDWQELFDMVRVIDFTEIRKHNLDKYNTALTDKFSVDSKRLQQRLEQAKEITALRSSNNEEALLKINTLQRFKAIFEKTSFETEMNDMIWDAALKDPLIPDAEIQKIFHELAYSCFNSRTVDVTSSTKLKIRLNQLIENATNLRKHEFLLHEEILPKETLRQFGAKDAAVISESLVNKMRELKVDKTSMVQTCFFSGCAYLLAKDPTAALRMLLEAQSGLSSQTENVSGQNIRVYLCLAEAYRQAHDFIQAEKILVKIEPEKKAQDYIGTSEIDAYVNTEFARILEDKGNYKGALESWARAGEWFKDLAVDKKVVDYGNLYIKDILAGPLDVLQGMADSQIKLGHIEEGKRLLERRELVAPQLVPVAPMEAAASLRSAPSVKEQVEEAKQPKTEVDEASLQWHKLMDLTLAGQKSKALAEARNRAYAIEPGKTMDGKLELLVAFNLIENSDYQLAKEVLEHLPQNAESAPAKHLRLLLRSYCYQHMSHPEFAHTLMEEALFDRPTIVPTSDRSPKSLEREFDRILLAYYAKKIALESNNRIRADRYQSDLRKLIEQSLFSKEPLASSLLK